MSWRTYAAIPRLCARMIGLQRNDRNKAPPRTVISPEFSSLEIYNQIPLCEEACAEAQGLSAQANSSKPATRRQSLIPHALMTQNKKKFPGCPSVVVVGPIWVSSEFGTALQTLRCPSHDGRQSALIFLVRSPSLFSYFNTGST